MNPSLANMNPLPHPHMKLDPFLLQICEHPALPGLSHIWTKINGVRINQLNIIKS